MNPTPIARPVLARRRATLMDVVPFARASCGNCNGRGIVLTLPSPKAKARKPRACGCAIRRFAKLPGVVFDDGGLWVPVDSTTTATTSPEASR